MIDSAQTRPTDRAKDHFSSAESAANFAGHIANIDETKYKVKLTKALEHLAQGLSEIATGQRATYLLLEEIKRTLNQRR